MYFKLKEDQQMKSEEKNTKVFDSTIIKFIIVGDNVKTNCIGQLIKLK